MVEMSGRDRQRKLCFFFFFQAEDGIRDYKVTGVQTCALPISGFRGWPRSRAAASSIRTTYARTVSPCPRRGTTKWLSSGCELFKSSTMRSPPCASTTASKRDRKSTRLNSSHLVISYAVFCLKKKKNTNDHQSEDEFNNVYH